MDKLDNVAKFLDKNFSKDQSGDMIKNQINKMDKFISNLSEKVAKIASEKLNQSVAFSSNHKELKLVLDSLKKRSKNAK